MTTCKHLNNISAVAVTVCKDDSGDLMYKAAIGIRCSDCGKSFQIVPQGELSENDTLLEFRIYPLDGAHQEPRPSVADMSIAGNA